MKSKIDQFIESNEHLVDQGIVTRVENSIVLHIPKTSLKVILNEFDLEKLEQGRLIEHNKKFKYHPHYGFSFETYGEYFLGSGSNINSFYELYGQSLHADVEFWIGSVLYEFSQVSDICQLLLEPCISRFEYAIADRGLQEYFLTLKIYNCDQANRKDAIVKGLFHLNTSIGGKKIDSLSVFHIFPRDFDIADEVDAMFDDDELLKRVYITGKASKKTDFISTAPLYLFIHAKTLKGTERFLAFYRVLEYFFGRSLEHKIDKMRFKSNVKSLDLLKEITLKDERGKLDNLLGLTISSPERDSLIAEFNLQNKLSVPITSLRKLSDKLYDYRCSLVHAKEEEIAKTQLPDIFAEDQESQYFERLVEILAERSINRFNRIKKKSGRNKAK